MILTSTKQSSAVIYHPTPSLESYLRNLGYRFLSAHPTSNFTSCCFLISLDRKQLVGISEYEASDMMRYVPRIDTVEDAKHFLHEIRGKLLGESMGI